MDSLLFPVLLSGGAGVRLWPLSREKEPKPFIRVSNNQSLLQKTYLRALSIPDVQTILTVTNQEYFSRTHGEYSELIENDSVLKLVKNQFLLEPEGRNTAPAIALAAFMLREQYGDNSLMLVLSADHLIENETNFLAAVQDARKMASDGYLVTFGIKPTRPETGYGYIRGSSEISGTKGYKADKFVEKPSLDLAEKYLSSDEYYWNAGIFCFKVSQILSELEELHPDLYQSAFLTWKETYRHSMNKDIYSIDAENFSKVPSISLDYAVMEKSANVSIIPSKFSWSDIGSWESMCSFVPEDDKGNRIDGKAVLIDSKNSYIQSRNRFVAGVGIEDLIIVDTDDAVLVVNRSKTQEVRKVVDHLKSIEDDVYKFHKLITYPWGTIKVLDENEQFRLSRISMKFGREFSSLTYNIRPTYLTVVNGIAKVTFDNKTYLLHSNESVLCPSGHIYTIENCCSQSLTLIEMQTNESIIQKDSIEIEKKNQKKTC